jgi:hypothetical protein
MNGILGIEKRAIKSSGLEPFYFKDNKCSCYRVEGSDPVGLYGVTIGYNGS